MMSSEYENRISIEDLFSSKGRVKVLKELATDEIGKDISFWADISLVESDNESFEKKSSKILKILSDDNRDAWTSIMENKYPLIK